MKNIHSLIQSNHDSAVQILASLPNNELAFTPDGFDWDNAEYDGVISENDLENEELRDLPCVSVANDYMINQVLVLKVFLEKNSLRIRFYGAIIDDNGNIIPEFAEYDYIDCCYANENIIYEEIDARINK